MTGVRTAIGKSSTAPTPIESSGKLFAKSIKDARSRWWRGSEYTRVHKDSCYSRACVGFIEYNSQDIEFNTFAPRTSPLNGTMDCIFSRAFPFPFVLSVTFPADTVICEGNIVV